MKTSTKSTGKIIRGMKLDSEYSPLNGENIVDILAFYFTLAMAKNLHLLIEGRELLGLYFISPFINSGGRVKESL